MGRSEEFLATAREHVKAARRIQDKYQGKQMPLAEALKAEGHIGAAQRLRDEARQSEPQYKHAMGAADAGWGGHARGIDGPASPSSGVKVLTKDESLVDHVSTRKLDRELLYGALGMAFKARVGPVDPAEVARWTAPFSEGKDMLTGGSGGVLVPSPIAAEVLDLLRSKAVVTRLGARVVPVPSKSLTIPRLTGDPNAQWLAEGATITGSDASLDGVTFTPKRLACLTKVSQELAEDSDPVEVGRVLAQSIAANFAVKVDAAALRGSGTGNEPAGVRNSSGVQILDMGANGAAASWSTLVELQRRIASANADGTGFVGNPRTLFALEDTKDLNGQYVAPPSVIAQLPRLDTTAVPTTLTKGTGSNLAELYAGDWSQLLLGVRIGFELTTLVERYADEGKIGVVARTRVDVKLAHGPAFAVADAVTN